MFIRTSKDDVVSMECVSYFTIDSPKIIFHFKDGSNLECIYDDDNTARKYFNRMNEFFSAKTMTIPSKSHQSKKQESFEKFWDMYKKGNKKVAEGEWLRLSNKDIDMAFKHTQEYIKSRDFQFVKNCERWIREKGWEYYVKLKEKSNKADW